MLGESPSPDPRHIQPDAAFRGFDRGVDDVLSSDSVGERWRDVAALFYRCHKLLHHVLTEERQCARVVGIAELQAGTHHGSCRFSNTVEVDSKYDVVD